MSLIFEPRSFSGKKLARIRAISLFCLLAFAVSAGVSQTSSDYDALVQKGKTQLQAGNAAQALDLAEQAIKADPQRWEAYALARRALMNLKRYEKAAYRLSKSIDFAPPAKQSGLRDLRKQCALAEAGFAPPASQTSAANQSSSSAMQAEIVLWKSIENSRNPADFQSYLQQYPNGAFVVLAQRHLNEFNHLAAQQEAQARQRAQREIAEGTWTIGGSPAVEEIARQGMWVRDRFKSATNAPVA